MRPPDPNETPMRGSSRRATTAQPSRWRDVCRPGRRMSRGEQTSCRRAPLNNHGGSNGAGRAMEQSDRTARDSAVHRELTEGWRSSLLAPAHRRCSTLTAKDLMAASNLPAMQCQLHPRGQDTAARAKKYCLQPAKRRLGFDKVSRQDISES